MRLYKVSLTVFFNEKYGGRLGSIKYDVLADGWLEARRIAAGFCRKTQGEYLSKGIGCEVSYCHEVRRPRFFQRSIDRFNDRVKRAVKQEHLEK